jgi:dTDP-4-dehydrorhamnose reductase
VDRVLGVLQLNVVISTAAFHKVEECEKQPVQSLAVNATGPRNLAPACRQNNAVLVHFRTDYVFDGGERRSYKESDLPRPQNVYGVSKLAGEHMVRLSWERHFVIRTCGLYGVAGSAGKGGNFVETMLKKGSEGCADTGSRPGVNANFHRRLGRNCEQAHSHRGVWVVSRQRRKANAPGMNSRAKSSS